MSGPTMTYEMRFYSNAERDAFLSVETAVGEMVSAGHDLDVILETLLLYGLVRVHMSDDLASTELLISRWHGRAIRIRDNVITRKEPDLVKASVIPFLKPKEKKD